MPITALPVPPSTDDPSSFDTRADAFLGALPTFQAEANALEENVNAKEASAVAAAIAAGAASAAAVGATGYVGTSSTSLSLTVGAKAITVAESGRSFADGQRVTLIRLSDPNLRMGGLVSLADMGARTMTVTVDSVTGAGGPFADWLVILTALEAESPSLSTARAIAFATAL